MQTTRERLLTLGAYECGRCRDGIRHPLGNCIVCGRGPAPGAVEHLAKTKKAKEAAMQALIPHLKMHANMGGYLVALAAFNQEQLEKAVLLPD